MKHGLSSCGSQVLEGWLSSRGARAYLAHSMWNLPGPGIKPMSPASAGRLLPLDHRGSLFGSLAEGHGRLLLDGRFGAVSLVGGSGVKKLRTGSLGPGLQK